MPSAWDEVNSLADVLGWRLTYQFVGAMSRCLRNWSSAGRSGGLAFVALWQVLAAEEPSRRSEGEDMRRQWLRHGMRTSPSLNPKP